MQGEGKHSLPGAGVLGDEDDGEGVVAGQRYFLPLRLCVSCASLLVLLFFY